MKQFIREYKWIHAIAYTTIETNCWNIELGEYFFIVIIIFNIVVHHTIGLFILKQPILNKMNWNR